jgi:hypothetical protein
MENTDKVVNRPPVLFDQTQEIIAQIEHRVDGAFLAYWTSPEGSICHNDVQALYEILQILGRQKKITLFIKSSGGDAQASLRLVTLLRDYTDFVTAAIPVECASAATMIALGADEIHMGPLAYLTAIDTALQHELSPIDKDNNLVSVSQDELLRVVNLWQKVASERDSNAYESLFQYVHPLVVGAIDRATSLSIKLCSEILRYHIKDKEKAESISNHLNSAYPSHSYPITLVEAARIGLHVKPLEQTVNELLLELNELYSEMGQKCTTDFDEQRSHSNDIVNILEGRGVQIFYQNDKDWRYIKDERRWITLNDTSAWHRLQKVDGKTEGTILHIR